MFVREPLHRMVSAYKNKFLQIPGYTKDIRKEIVKEFRPESYDPDGKTSLASQNSFSTFPTTKRETNIGDNTRRSVIRVLSTTILLATMKRWRKMHPFC